MVIRSRGAPWTGMAHTWTSRPVVRWGVTGWTETLHLTACIGCHCPLAREHQAVHEILSELQPKSVYSLRRSRSLNKASTSIREKTSTANSYLESSMLSLC